jgi:DNA polymerase-3 subunit chi
MGTAMFYHLTRSSAEATARSLLDKSLPNGWRVMIRGTDPAALERLDHRLWTEPAEGFLPHGVQGGATDADQPVLLGQGAIANGAQVLLLIDGAETTPEEVAMLERVCVLFEGGDPERLFHARQQWKRLTDAGVAAQYWSEETGRWVKKAEKNA